jgi:tRNA A-37 threonylcarbamoyl transferase component Bud32/tetratricopeptide (TPR) repeat protein
MAAVESKLFGEPRDPVKVGRFEVLDRLGEGAMGVVYRARDPGLEREVAVKLIASRFTDEAGAAARLRREARALARLEHPNVVKVLDVGAHDGRVFVAMEKVDGGTLLEWAHAHPPGTPDRIAQLRSLLEQAADGLAAAHRSGVVHRDVKPHNMLLGRDGRLRLADFGLASTSIARVPTDPGFDVTLEASLSEAGAVVGTPAYMAPEQFEGLADERTDQFSLCASFWEAAYGERAYPGATLAAVLEAMRERPPRPPAHVRDVPAWIGRVLARGLSTSPSDRYPSIDALRADLRRRRGRRGAIAAATLGAAGVLVLFAVDGDEDRCASPPRGLEHAWSPDVQASVRERFIAAVPDDGASAFTDVDAALHGYADDWRREWSDACAATWRDGTQTEAALDMRMRCLARAQQAHASVVDILTNEDLELAVVTRAATATEYLPAVAACRDLDHADAHPLPDDPSTRAEIERLRGELDALMLFMYATNVQHDAERARALSAAADATGYPPLQVEAALGFAELLIAMRDPEVLDVLDRTMALATASGLHASAVRCALLQSDAAELLGAGDPARHIAHARAWAQRIEDDNEREHVLHRMQLVDAAKLIDENEYESATRLIDPAIAYYEAQTDPQSAFRLLGAYEQRGQALMHLSRYADAERDLQRALAQRERLPQDNTQHESQIRSMLARIAMETGRPEIAAEQFEALLPVVERSLGTRHPAYAATTGNLAGARVLAGDREGGIAGLRRALALSEETNPPGHPTIVLGRSNLAGMLEPGPEKMTLHNEACDLALEHHGPQSEVYAMTRAMYADDLREAGEHVKAIAMAEEALAVFERSGKDRKVVDALVTLSRAYTGSDRAEHGLALAERAVAEARSIYGEGEVKTATAELALAWALHGLRRDDEAREALTRADRAATAQRQDAHVDDSAALHRELDDDRARGRARAPIGQ